MDRYYQQALETQRVLREANRESLRTLVSPITGTYRGAKTAVNGVYEGTKGILKYLGFGGTAGIVAGTLVAGPIGGLVGLVVGKNSREIGHAVKETAKGVGNTLVVATDALIDAGMYENMDPSSRYQSSVSQYTERNRTLDESVVAAPESSASPIASQTPNPTNSVQQAPFTIIHDESMYEKAGKVLRGSGRMAGKALKRSGKAFGRSIGYTARGVKDALCYSATIARNSGKYKQLERLASKLSEKEGRPFTPEETLDIVKKEAEKKKKMKIFKEIQKELLIKRNEMLFDPSQQTPENKNYYNRLVMQQMILGQEIGIEDPSKYYSPLR